MRYLRLAVLFVFLIPGPVASQDPSNEPLPYYKVGSPFQSEFACKPDPLPAPTPAPAVKYLPKPKPWMTAASVTQVRKVARGGTDTQQFTLRFFEFGTITADPHAGAQLILAKFYYSHDFERDRQPRRGVNYKRYLLDKGHLIPLTSMSETPDDSLAYQTLLKKLKLVEAPPEATLNIRVLEKPVTHIAAANLCFTFWEQLPEEHGPVGKVIGRNPFYGSLYFPGGEMASNKYIHAALPDGTVLAYYLLPPAALNNPTALSQGLFSSRSQISGKDDEESGPAGDVMYLSGKPNAELRVLRDLPALGKVYALRDDEKAPYAEYKMMWQSYRKEPGPSKITPLLNAAEYAARVPDFYWQDPLDRWVMFTNTTVRFPMAAEPLLYLYPTVPQPVSVRFGDRLRIAAAEPALTDGSWHVLARPDGMLLLGSLHRGSLFWEGTSLPLAPPESGFLVLRDALPQFFEDVLPRLGLNESESYEFQRYWLNHMQGHKYYLISFLDRQTIDAFAPIEITPAPDTFIRVLMDFVALDDFLPLPVPALPATPVRQGFVAVEWGGMQR